MEVWLLFIVFRLSISRMIIISSVRVFCRCVKMLMLSRLSRVNRLSML